MFSPSGRVKRSKMQPRARMAGAPLEVQDRCDLEQSLKPAGNQP
ncbi:MAG: hypothetical protein ACI9JK_001477 [Phycisphaerales bacterium]|jgi:hypothetical protein